MNNLYQFESFNFEKFWKGKKGIVIAISGWEEYKDGEKTGNLLGSNVTVSILQDNTVYKPNKKGIVYNNLGEKIFFKIPVHVNDINIKVNDYIGYEKGCYSPVVKSANAYPSRQGSNFKDALSVEVVSFDKV